jgi:hypothetical protein
MERELLWQVVAYLSKLNEYTLNSDVKYVME